MKKIIDGKTYNTDTAEYITGDRTNLLARNDWNYEDWDLYCTPKGAFFMRGEGGPLTRWGVSLGGGMRSGSGPTIIAISEEEARWIVERDCSAEEYERLFGMAEAA